MMEGWLCPRCKRVNAPWVSQCTCTRCHETITTNTPTVGDQPSTWPNEPNWATCCDKVFTAVLASDKIASTTGGCSCSNKTESLNGKMPS